MWFSIANKCCIENLQNKNRKKNSTNNDDECVLCASSKNGIEKYEKKNIATKVK